MCCNCLQTANSFRQRHALAPADFFKTPEFLDDVGTFAFV